jgi:hypothetical protein
MMRHRLSCAGPPLLVLLFLFASLQTEAFSSTGSANFESLLKSGNRQDAYDAAVKLTQLEPHHGYSWYTSLKVCCGACPLKCLCRYLLAIALEAQGQQSSDRLFQALNEAVKCHQHPPPPPAYLRLKQMYEEHGLLEQAGYILLSGAESHPSNLDIWVDICFLLLRMLSKSCLRVCQTVMRLFDINSIQGAAPIKQRVAGGLASAGAVGLAQEAIGIFALSDHQPHVGLFWLLRSLDAQSRPLHRSSAVKPRTRTVFWALVARARLLAWDISIPLSDDFFSGLKSLPAKEVTDSIVAFHFLEAGGPPDMILWLMRLHASRFVLFPCVYLVARIYVLPSACLLTFAYLFAYVYLIARICVDFKCN